MPKKIKKIDYGCDAMLAYFHAIVTYFSVTNGWHTNTAEDTIKYY